MGKKGKFIRVEIHWKMIAKIKNLMAISGLWTLRDFLNTAVNILQWTIEQAREGRTIVSVDKVTGETRELTAPFLEHVWDHSAAQDSDDS
ncbi:MAG TPA: hypothetical protein VJI96_00680 [Candidatus Andersenbacteria bacterium]|nr:hypothetical protein [Candidatus Andersenbacteria bacterium]